jgi:hypothetical protein
MLAVLLTSLLAVPVFPLNPTAQDTLASKDLHFTVGLGGPDRFVSISPEVTAKYEMLIHHPYMVRGTCGYRYGQVSSKLYPKGAISGITFSVEGLYYRGTDKLTGYLAAGPIMMLNYIAVSAASADSLRSNHGITDASFRPAFGYRITLGLRYHRVYSLEVSASQWYSKLVYTRRLSPTVFSQITEKTSVGDVRVTIGYLFLLGRL